jgi:CBS domain-containing membrane protein
MQKSNSSTMCHPANQGNSVHVQWAADETSNKRFRLIDLIDDMCAGKDVFFRFVRAVKDIMPNSVKTLTLDDTIGKALEFMKQSDIRHVCVVDVPIGKENKPYFVGVVSERDIFRQIPPNTEKVNGAKTNPKVHRQLLAQVVTRKPKTVSPETSIANMLSIMLDNHVDMVPVLDGENLVSVVTTSDVMKLIIRFEAIFRLSAKPKETGRLPDKKRASNRPSAGSDNAASLFTTVLQTVKETMAEQVVCLGTEDNLAAAMNAIQKGQFRHLPILDEEGALVGLISDRDVLRYLPFVGGQRLPKTGEFRSTLFHVDMRDPSLNLPVTSIMTRNITHVRPDCAFYDAVKMLDELKISCLPVVDEEKKLLGIITITDVMKTLLGAYEADEKSVA